MRRAAKNRAGAVPHQHEVRDPYGQGLRVVERVFDGQAGIEAKLFGLFDGLFAGADLCASCAERFQLIRLLRHLDGQRVIW